MHFDWNALAPLVGLAATIFGGWIGHRIASPKDHERAELLTRIAEETAAVIYASNPTAAWTDLVRDTVARIAGAAGLPTNNTTAIQNAATAALLKLKAVSPQAKVGVTAGAAR